MLTRTFIRMATVCALAVLLGAAANMAQAETLNSMSTGQPGCTKTKAGTGKSRVAQGQQAQAAPAPAPAGPGTMQGQGRVPSGPKVTKKGPGSKIQQRQPSGPRVKKKTPVPSGCGPDDNDGFGEPIL